MFCAMKFRASLMLSSSTIALISPLPQYSFEKAHETRPVTQRVFPAGRRIIKSPASVRRFLHDAVLACSRILIVSDF
jgi:hypothetical protein